MPKEEACDIICCHFGPYGGIGTILKGYWKNARLVTFFHAFDLTIYPNTHGKDCYTEQFGKTDLALSINKYWVPRLRELGCNEPKIGVHHMGVDVKKFKPQKRRSSDRIRILTIGRLTEKKGLEYSIKAVAEAIKQNPEFQIEYNIIGGGKLKDRLGKLVKELNMEQNILLLGPKKQEQLRKYLYGSDIFVLSSNTAKDGDMEGIPVSLMEAMATGLPVVSTTHSGIAELVDSEVNGLLVPPKDLKGLADSISTLVKSPKKRVKFGREARKKIEMEFNCQKQVTKLENAFEKLIQGNK